MTLLTPRGRRLVMSDPNRWQHRLFVWCWNHGWHADDQGRFWGFWLVKFGQLFV